MSISIFPRALQFFAFILFSFSGNSQGITTPRVPSPAATVSQTVGISTVTINYSRPSVKGRDIWGALVPYGWNKQAFGTGNEAPWRAGANENTTIHFSHDAMVEGKQVPAGMYGLFFVINKDNTGEVVLSKDSRSWAVFSTTKNKIYCAQPSRFGRYHLLKSLPTILTMLPKPRRNLY